MSIVTKARLITLTENQVRYKTFSEVLNEAKSEGKTTARTSVFLSHSHGDLEKDYVKRAIAFLRNLGLRIYIDSDDSALPPYTNATTASKIKSEIKSNKKFISLATNEAIESPWCNWELGFGDSYKYIDNLALFPLAENSGNWKGNEYLQIYSHIEEQGSTGQFRVIYPDGKTIALTNWLIQ
jgi:hypothetical protein